MDTQPVLLSHPIGLSHNFVFLPASLIPSITHLLPTINPTLPHLTSHPSPLPSPSNLLPLSGVHSDSTRFTQLRGDQDPPLLAVSSGDRDGLVSGVSPVDVLVNPVYCQALWRG